MIYLRSVQNFIVRLGHQRVYSKKLHFFYNIFIKKFKVSKQISSSNYWSSTTNANNSDNAWNVNFNNGNTNNNNKNNTNYVRCVRAGE